MNPWCQKSTTSRGFIKTSTLSTSQCFLSKANHCSSCMAISSSSDDQEAPPAVTPQHIPVTLLPPPVWVEECSQTWGCDWQEGFNKPCHLVIVSFGLPLPQGWGCTYGWLWETRLHKLRACGFSGFLLSEQVCYSGSNSVQGKGMLWLRPNLCFFSLRKVDLSSGSGQLCPCL